MALINYHHNLYSVGIEIFKPYIKQLKSKKIHSKYILQDIRKLSFPDKSFDVVMACQVVEHINKKDAILLLKKMERIAKRLVVISTPVGPCSYHTDDGNKHQNHKCYFYPEYFEKIGYRVIRIGGKNLVGEKGLYYKIDNSFLKKMIYVLDLLLIPYYILFQKKSDYYFFAYKEI
jgi:ubiquinone/menaquinone biosynthesis C-methylase UbiE